jgi:hypothetical protein
MATVITSSIGTASRTYSTLQAWEDASPANLVTSDQVWRGEVYNDSAFSSGSALLTITGTTTDATRYKEITAAAGQSFQDTPSNALSYNTANGVSILCTGGYVTAISVNENYARVNRLQFRSSAATGTGTRTILFSGTGTQIDSCIIAGRSNINVMELGQGDISNCLIVREASPFGASLLVNGNGNAKNVTIIDFATSSKGLTQDYSGGSVFTNVVAMGSTDSIIKATNSSGATFTNCMKDNNVTSITGVTNNITFSTANFVNVTNGTENFKLLTGSALVNAGSSTGSPKDIFGTTRPQGASYDVGCWELVVSSSNTPFAKRLPWVSGINYLNNISSIKN